MVESWISEIFSPKQLMLEHFLMLMELIPLLFRKCIFQASSVTKVLLIPLVFLSTPCSMQDLSSSTRDRTHAPCTGSSPLNHWTAREVNGLPEKSLITFVFTTCSDNLTILVCKSSFLLVHQASTHSKWIW